MGTGRSKVALVVCTAALLALAGIARATGTLDQSDSIQNDIETFAAADDTAQTFTAGLSGTLREVDLPLEEFTAGSAITVDIETVSAGAPSNHVLASASVAQAGLPVFVAHPPPDYPYTPVVFSSPPAVTAGQQYAIVLTVTSGEDVIANDTGQTYLGGGNFSRIAGIWFGPNFDDLAFRTYVGPALPSAVEDQRAGYCSVAGNTWRDGTAIPPGTFLNLEFGQPDTDASVKGAVPANYIAATGITCDPPPIGDTLQGTYNGPDAADGIYPYYAPPAS